jgi:uncharacterized cupredoxin-like copper-binding protein
MRKLATIALMLAAVMVTAVVVADLTARAQLHPTSAALPHTPRVEGLATIKVGNAMKFEPSTIVAKAGEPLEVILINEGFMPHDFTLTQGVTQPVKIKADSRETARGVLTIEQPGTYTFFCSVPGHAEAGMRGTLRVE